MFLHNDPSFKERRKNLRNNETKEEKFLWSSLKGKKFGYKFVRQHSFGPYILDFYCSKKKLAIELDGYQHLENKDYDKERNDYLSLRGIKTLRFWNNELNDNIDNILEKIKNELNMNFKYIDIHSHLNFKDFDTDREAVIQNMIEGGIATITVGTDVETSKEAILLAEKYENLFASVGVHPTDVMEHSFDENVFLEIAQHKKVLAIGECGLDYFRIKHDANTPARNDISIVGGQMDTNDTNEIEELKNKQKEIFIQHIKLAIKVNKPLMIHARPSKGNMDAYNDVIDILEIYKGSTFINVNFHFFVGDIDVAKRIIEHGWTMSFDGPITFTDEYNEVIQYIPIENIMAETDSPFASPAPYRGRRAEPNYVPHIYEAIARIKNMDTEIVRLTLNQNAKRVFDIE